MQKAGERNAYPRRFAGREQRRVNQALRELFNLDWQLDDLGLHQVKAARPRLRQLALYALPEQRSALDTLAHRQRATAHGMLARGGWRICLRSSVPRSTWWKKPGVCARISHAALRSSG
jgi:hypothetical protein